MTRSNDHEKLSSQLRKETDEIIFQGMEMSEQMKTRIRKQAAAESIQKHRFLPKRWMVAAITTAAAVIIVLSINSGSQPSNPLPVDPSGGIVTSPVEGGAASGVSELVSQKLTTWEEAKEAFGADLLPPSQLPQGYEIADITVVGFAGGAARDLLISYGSGDQTIMFTVSRMAAAFPADLFSPVQVGGEEGLIYEQPTLTELFWTSGGLQYSITGPLSADEAIRMAVSIVS